MAKNRRKISRNNKGFSETGASYTRKTFKGFTSTSGSPNEDINYNNHTLRQRSRVLSMSGGIALSALKTTRTNVIGCGLILQSRIDKDELGMTDDEARIWQKKTEKEFAIWAENKIHCDAIGMNDFYKMQQLVFYSSIMNGDAFTLIQRDKSSVSKLLPYSLRLNIVEADRVSTPNSFTSGCIRVTDGKNSVTGNKIYDGVEVDKKGKVVAYHVSNNYPFELTSENTEWERVEAYGEQTLLPNVIHTMADVERAGQYRSTPLLAPVLEMLLQIRRYTDAELMAAVVESLFTAFIKTTTNQNENPLSNVQTGEEPLPDLDDSEYEMGTGNIVHLAPDEDVTFGDPKRPAGGFQAFVNAVAVQIGASLEISKEILLKEFNSSYSAARAALLEFWKVVKMRREWFVSDFCRPIYEIWMYEAIARGRIKAPGFFDDPIKRMAWLGAEFTGPSQGMLDPIKEISAEVMACENGFSTRSESTMRLNGTEYYRNVTELKSENGLLTEASITTPQTKEIIQEYIKEMVKTEVSSNNVQTTE